MTEDALLRAIEITAPTRGARLAVTLAAGTGLGYQGRSPWL